MRVKTLCVNTLHLGTEAQLDEVVNRWLAQQPDSSSAELKINYYEVRTGAVMVVYTLVYRD